MSSGSSQLDPREADDDRAITAGQLPELSNQTLRPQLGISPQTILRGGFNSSNSSFELTSRQTARRGRGRPIGSRGARGRPRIDRSRPYDVGRRSGGRNRESIIPSEIVANQLLLQLNVTGSINTRNPREIEVNFNLQAPEGFTFYTTLNTDSNDEEINIVPDNTNSDNGTVTIGTINNQEQDTAIDGNQPESS